MALDDLKKKLPYLEPLIDDEKQHISNSPSRWFVPELLDELLATLTPHEEYVLKMRYGLGRLEHTRVEVATHFERPESWVRQTEARALRKLRHPARANLIQKYFEKAEELLGQPDSTPIELVPVIENVKQLTPALIAYLKSHTEDLNDVRWEVFEHLVAEFFASWGFEDVRLVGRVRKTSADIFAAHIINPIGIRARYFIEVKRWKDKVGVGVIDQVYGAMINERPTLGWHAAIIVSSVGFKNFEKYSREALELKGIELKDRSDLLDWLKGYKPNKNGLWLPNPSTTL